MKLIRSLCFAILAATLVGFGIASSVPAADTPKSKLEEKKDLRLKLKAALAKKQANAEKPAPSTTTVKSDDTIQAPAKPYIKPIAQPMSDVIRFLDEQINAKLTAEKLTPSGPANDAEFLRRVYLDLTGVIPTVEQTRTFLDDKDSAKRAKLIDELLASPNYGQHQADIWQAKLMSRDSNNRFVQRDPFIDWIAASFNKNTPWDQFVTQLVTATGTVESNPEVTYFFMNRSVDKLTDSVGQHFLGLQIMCAQCHNHPFTTTKQTEYWGMAAFFNNVSIDRPQNANKGGDNMKIGVREGNGPSRTKEFFPESTKKVAPKFLEGDEPKLSASEPHRPALAKWLTSGANPYFAKAMVNRTWAQLFGSGVVNPVDDMHVDNLPSHPELLATLATQFIATGFDVKQLYRTICNSQAYQRTSKPSAGNETDHKLFSHMTVKVLMPEQLFDSLKSITNFTTPAKPGGKLQAALGRGPVTPRDSFVQFFLAGAEHANTTEYEAGIPQALRLMNSRIAGNPAAAKAFVKPGAKPAEIIEEMYLAVLSRRPTPDEVTKLTDYLSSNTTTGYADVLWVLLNSSEFTLVR